MIKFLNKFDMMKNIHIRLLAVARMGGGGGNRHYLA